jgi:dolichol-phosphate mannosyltransferase
VTDHSARPTPSPTAPALSVVVPTLNERDNLSVLFDRISVALAGVAWEMIVVDDDSADGTAAWAKARGATDGRLRCLRRVGRRGLAGAAIEGMLASSAAVVAVMDGDLQHDETILGPMLDIIRQGRADLVIGTRLDVPSTGALSRPRRWLSQAGKALSRLVLSRDVSDPMSGFFAVRRDLVEDIAPRLVTDGFKILVDVLFSMPAETRVAEVGYAFRERLSGTSKLDARILLDYGGLMVHRLSGDLISARLTTYLVVGATGLLVHLGVLRALVHLAPGVGFARMEILASYAAMAVNFALNNALTFRERRARGWSALPAFALYCGVCSVGVVADTGIAGWAFSGSPTWWVAGLLGALVGSFWNYAMSATIVWSSRTGRPRTPRRSPMRPREAVGADAGSGMG